MKLNKWMIAVLLVLGVVAALQSLGAFSNSYAEIPATALDAELDSQVQ